MEFLESRRLLSANPLFQVTSKGTLIVHGTVEANEIEVFFVHGKASQGVGAIVGVPDHGLQRLSNVFRAKAHSVKRILIDAGGGNDSINITQVTRPATVLGGTGNDNINQDLSGPMLAYGGAGNDFMGGQAQLSVSDVNLDNFDLLNSAFVDMKSSPLNTLNGGIGDDTLFGDINTQLNGGADNDQADLFISSESPLTDDRVNALAEGYYQQIGTQSIEQIKGISQVDGPPILFG